MEEYRKKGGTGAVDSTGKSLYQGQFVIPCIDDPFYQKYATRYLTKVAQHFGNDERVSGYVLWGEPLLTLNGGSTICYCEHTLKKFRLWLKEKYKTIDALNEVWRSEGPADFDNFSSVYPPTGWGRQAGGFESWVDWRTFMEGNLAGHIKAADDLMKKNGANQPTITEMVTNLHNGLDPWKLAETTDIIGISCFNEPDKMSAMFMNMANSMSHALEKNTFVVEANGGPVKYGWDAPALSITAEHMKSTILQRASYGTTGLMFWCWRPRITDTEGNDFGMAKPNGKVLKRTLETGALAEQVLASSDKYYASERVSDVAIFMDQSIIHLIDADYMQDNYINAVTGCHHMLLDMHINSDFITEEYVKKGLLSKYKVLILPCAFVLSDAVGAAIEEFVRNGGVVIADYNLADKRPGGYCYEERPGAGLQPVFGIDIDDIFTTRHPVHLEENAFGIACDVATELITPIGAEVKATFKGRPILTENTYHNGKGIYFCTQFFKRYFDEPQQKMRKTLLDIFAGCGVTPHLIAPKCDQDDVNYLLTSTMQDKKTGDLSVLTLVNSGYAPIEDEIVLPKGTYQILNNNGNCSIKTDGENTTLSLSLTSFDSIALLAE